MIGISTNGTSFGTDKRINKIIDSEIDAMVISLHGGTAELSRRFAASAELSCGLAPEIQHGR